MNVNDFITQNVGLVYRVLGQFRRANPAIFNVIGDDLESAGLWAMKRVHDQIVNGGYDADIAKVSTYATTAITRWMLKTIAKHKRHHIDAATCCEWSRVKFDDRQIDLREAMAEEAEREIALRRIRRREQRILSEDAARGQRKLFEDAA